MRNQTTSFDESNLPRNRGAELPAPQALLQAIVEHVDDTIMLVDAAGQILFTNRELPAVGADALAGTSVLAFLPLASHGRFREALRSACELGKADRFEQRWIDGRWCLVRVAPVLEQMTPTAMVIATDVTHDKHTEQSLRESEERFRQLAENVREVFWLADWKEKRVLYVTNAYQRVWGRPTRYLYETATPWIADIHPEDRERVERAFCDSPRNRGFQAEYRIVRPDGTHRWIRDRGFLLRDADGQVGRIAGIAEDVTEQRNVESSLRMERKLLKRLLDLQERERRLLAYEIHDGFIQDLVGAKMLLESLRPCLSTDHPDCVERVDMVESALRKAIGEGRRMVSNLRPMVIDDAGIVAAIEYLISERSGAAPLQITFTHNVQFARLPPLLEGALFRIVQESLTNARRHSQAAHVDVELSQQDERVLLTIRDDGIGFDRAAVPEDRFGLRGLVERARLFGGRSQIRTEPGKGTEIWVELPMNKSGISV